jgi:phenylacetate-CoA ligase
VSALQEQLAYLEERSPFYSKRLSGIREHVSTGADLPRLPFTTKEDLREGQWRDPPFGPHLCAPRERLVRVHVTSGTTGEPVAVGFTSATTRPTAPSAGRHFASRTRGRTT